MNCILGECVEKSTKTTFDDNSKSLLQKPKEEDGSQQGAIRSGEAKGKYDATTNGHSIHYSNSADHCFF